MSQYLCLSVTFHDSFYHGKINNDEPEWPPSPYRLYQALIAGTFCGCRVNEWNDSKYEAYQWLQSRKPPDIITPDVQKSTCYTLFVPNNDSDKKNNRQDRLTSKIVRPHYMINGQVLYYLWKIEESEFQKAKSHVELLCYEARNLISLGWGIDMVAGNGKILTDQDVNNLSGIRWKPWEGYRPVDNTIRRVPENGSFDDLCTVYQSFIISIKGNVYKPPLPPKVFEEIHYMQVTQLPKRSYAAFTLQKIEDPNKYVAFRHNSVIHVAAMLRSQACKAAKKDSSHEFPGGSQLYVAGHTGKQEVTPERFSFLPLPSIGHQYSDGLIRRALIAEPYGGTGEHAKWAERRLRNRELTDTSNKKRCTLFSIKMNDSVIHKYIDSSREWFSVTPVILPGYDDGKYLKAEKLIVNALKQAGLPVESVENLVLRKAPYFAGAYHPKQYKRPSYLNHLPGWHTWIRFREPITGPISLGAGRHCGLGLFANID